MRQDNKVEVPFFLDKTGQIVKRGDYIVYSRTIGRSADLNFAKVINIKSGEGWRGEKIWGILVVAVTRGYHFGERVDKPMDKKITLQFPDRTIKIENLKEEVKVLLDSV